MITRGGHFTLVQKLATGGMAEIWLARQNVLDDLTRVIVVKRILGAFAQDDAFVQMFLDEARTSALLNHPNAVQIYDLGFQNGAFFIAMEYIEGENLAALYRRGADRSRPPSHTMVARIIADACKALHHAHELRGPNGMPLGLVHRDLSPQNILVSYAGHVKVVDFGVAKAATQQEVTSPGVLKGRYSYMSPEQCLGEKIDLRSDLFSLGILLYELTTGRRLFKDSLESSNVASGPSEETTNPISTGPSLELLEKITKREIPSPRIHAPSISLRLERIILRALERNVRLRFQTAEEMLIALEEYLHEDAAPSSTAAIGAYMQELFSEDLEDKRRLVEMINRGDLPGQGGEVASADQSELQALLDRLAKRAHAARAGEEEDVDDVPPAEPQLDPAVVVQLQRARRKNFAFVWALGLVMGLLIGAVLMLSVARPVQPAQAPPRVNYEQAIVKRGSIDVTTVPAGATLRLDGVPMGSDSDASLRTPITLKQLEYGKEYTLTLLKDGYQPAQQTVTMDERLDGAELRIPLVSLKRLAEASTKAERAQKPVQLPRTDPSSNPVTAGCHPDLSVVQGFLTIQTTPYSKIYYGERLLGETPISRVKLPAGCLELDAVTAPGVRKRFQVHIESNKVSIYTLEVK